MFFSYRIGFYSDFINNYIHNIFFNIKIRKTKTSYESGIWALMSIRYEPQECQKIKSTTGKILFYLDESKTFKLRQEKKLPPYGYFLKYGCFGLDLARRSFRLPPFTYLHTKDLVHQTSVCGGLITIIGGLCFIMCIYVSITIYIGCPLILARSVYIGNNS